MSSLREEPLAGRYSIVRELGRGGMATVYLARDLEAGTMVAVKVLRREVASRIGAARFAREIRIASQLQHQGIVPLLDSGESGGLPFFTMPFVQGESLSDRIARERQLPVAIAVRIAAELADALEFAHARGILHRDVKPGNVLLPNGHAMLADFGVARAMDVGAGDRLTDSGVSVGTPHYMSPEQASADRVDERSDIYSLGCVLYEMLAGTPPFNGPTPQSIQARHAVDAMPSIRSVRRTVNRQLERVIERALAKVPADRYASAAEFRAALVAASLDEDDDARVWTQNRVLLTAGGAIAVAGIALAAFLWMRSVTTLDRHRVVVFPLQATRVFAGAPTGEDIATLIGSMLDRRGALRWVDGWRLLEPHERTDSVATAPARARQIARGQNAGYYLAGRIVTHGDSSDVLLTLVDVAADTVVANARASGAAADAWRGALRAVTQLLPILLPGGAARDLAAAWTDRDPAAVASFLAGEAAFRRAQPGLALVHYRDAVRADTNFALAAVRGAQAATWDHRSAEAALLVHRALGKFMAPQYEHFTLGYAAYLAGLADSAVSEFRRAIAIDPEMAAAWAQLGETYIHLVPAASNPDALAEAAFDSARAIDSSSSHLLLHPIEIRLRRRDAAGAAPLLQQFVAAQPDSTLVAELRTMDACVRNGPDRVDWHAAVRANAFATLSAAVVLAGHGAVPDCAAAAYGAVIDDDTLTTASAAPADRASALVGLVGVLIAQNKPAAAKARIDTSVARGDGGASLLMLAALVAGSLDSSAAAVAATDSIRFGADFARCSTAERCWILGVYESARGRRGAAATIAAVLMGRAVKVTDPAIQSLAHAAAANAQLAHGDTAGARAAFARLLAEPLPVGPSLTWDPGGALGPERLTYARLLMAAGRWAEARAVADAFDAAAPASYALYLRPSLELRATAADRLHDSVGAATYRARLAHLSESNSSATRR